MLTLQTKLHLLYDAATELNAIYTSQPEEFSDYLRNFLTAILNEIETLT